MTNRMIEALAAYRLMTEAELQDAYMNLTNAFVIYAHHARERDMLKALVLKVMTEKFPVKVSDEELAAELAAYAA